MNSPRNSNARGVTSPRSQTPGTPGSDGGSTPRTPRSIGRSRKPKVTGRWKSDTVAIKCVNCSTPFNMWTRRHHCRCCGNVFCAGCTSKQIPIPAMGFEDPVRVCGDCFRDLDATAHPAGNGLSCFAMICGCGSTGPTNEDLSNMPASSSETPSSRRESNAALRSAVKKSHYLPEPPTAILQDAALVGNALKVQKDDRDSFRNQLRVKYGLGPGNTA